MGKFTEFTFDEAVAIAQRNMQEDCPSVSRVFLDRAQSEKARADAADSRIAALEAELTALRLGLESEIDSIRTGADFHEPDVRTLLRRIAYDVSALLTPNAANGGQP